MVNDELRKMKYGNVSGLSEEAGTFRTNYRQII